MPMSVVVRVRGLQEKAHDESGLSNLRGKEKGKRGSTASPYLKLSHHSESFQLSAFRQT